MNGPARPEIAVGALVVHDGCLLLVRRRRGPGAGRWAPPGGRVEFGETVREAVTREVQEETGIAVTVGELAGWVERRGSVPAPHHFVILDFVAAPSGATALVSGDDALDAQWVPLEDVASLDLVDGLLDFLVETGTLPPGTARGSHR